MADVAVAWLAFPALTLLGALGVGLIVERVAGRELSAEMLVVVGLAGFVVLSDVSTLFGRGAAVVSWGVPLAAAVGLVTRRRAIRRAVDRWTWAGALAGCAILAAPFVLSGQATFGGYSTLGDTAIQMLGAEILPELGRTTDGLPPSTVTAALDGYFAGNGYPSGAQAAVGILTRTLHGDIFGTYTAFLAVLAGGAGIAVGEMMRGLRAPGAVRAVAVGVAVAAPLVASYTWQGSIKEIATIAFVGASAVAVAWWIRELVAGAGPRAALVPAVPVAASVSVSSVGAAPWIGVVLLFALGAVVTLVRNDRSQLRRISASAGSGVGLAIVLSIPALLALGALAPVAGGVLTSDVELGNLGHPLPWWETFAPWLTFDYRRELVGGQLTVGHLGAAVIAGLALTGVVVAVRRRSLAVVSWVAASVVAWIFISHTGSPWAEAKSMAIAAPALFAAACVVAVPIARRSAALAGLLLLIPIVIVVASDVQGYRGVALAPVQRLGELRTIDARIGDGGSTLFPEFDEFAKVALRHSAPEIPGEPWRSRVIVGTDGSAVGTYAVSSDIAAVAARGEQGLRQFRYVVVRRGPVGSWPPGYRLRTSTAHYLVFEREGGTGDGPFDVRRVDGPLGAGARTVPCRRLGHDGVAQRRPLSVGLNVMADDRRPAMWLLHPGGAPRFADTKGPGHVTGTLVVPSSGLYRVWVEGSFNRRIDVRVAGRSIGSIEHARNTTPQPEAAGTIRLAAGRTSMTITRRGRSLLPGSANDPARAGVMGNAWLERADDTAQPVLSRDGCGTARDVMEADWLGRERDRSKR